MMRKSAHFAVSRLEKIRERGAGIPTKISLVVRSVLYLAPLFAVSAHLAFAQSGTLMRVEETTPAIRYTGEWYSNGSSLNSGGSAVLTNAMGAEATIIFDGTGITWVGFSDGWSGLASVYLDGTLTTVDTYSANAQYQRSLYSVRGLTRGVHNLTILVPHERGPNTQGSWVWIDRFDIENGMEVSGEVSLTAGRSEQTSAAITYAGVWYSNFSSVLSGGSSLLATDPGSLGTVTFTGSGITWIGYGDPWSGIAKVSVDGVLRATVDTYRATSQSQARLFSIGALPSGTHTLTVEATGTHNASSGGTWIWLDAFEVVDDSGGAGGSSEPTIDSGGLANAASGIGRPVAGSIVSLFGSGFASAPLNAVTVPLPTTLGTTTVRVNGIAAPLFYVSPSQINLQVPWELSGQSQISVSVTAGATSSTPVSSALTGFAPGIFATDGSGTGQGAVIIAGTSSIAAPEGFLVGSRPVARGEHLAIYCTGLGPVTNQPNSGGRSSSEPFASTIASPTVLIGGVPAPVEFAGLAPGFVGLYQVNVQVPLQVMVGSQVPIVLAIGGVTSNTVTVAIR